MAEWLGKTSIRSLRKPYPLTKTSGATKSAIEAPSVKDLRLLRKLEYAKNSGQAVSDTKKREMLSTCCGTEGCKNEVHT